MSASQQPGLADHLHTCEVAGNQIVYWEKGSGEPIVLIHGMFGDYLDWEPVLEPLAETFRVVAFDLPGFGASGKPQIEYTAEFFVATLHELLVLLGIRRPLLVGNSFGGELSILYAIEHPEYVKGLVLVSSGGLRFYSNEQKSKLRENFSVSNLRLMTPAINEFIFAGIFSRESEQRRRYIAKQNAKLQRDDFPAYTVALFQCMVLAFELYFDEELRAIAAPVLLLWGDADTVFPVALAERALTRLPNARLQLLPRAGHAPQLEAPGDFVAAIREFAGLVGVRRG